MYVYIYIQNEYIRITDWGSIPRAHHLRYGRVSKPGISLPCTTSQAQKQMFLTWVKYLDPQNMYENQFGAIALSRVGTRTKRVVEPQNMYKKACWALLKGFWLLSFIFNVLLVQVFTRLHDHSTQSSLKRDIDKFGFDAVLCVTEPRTFRRRGTSETCSCCGSVFDNPVWTSQI